MNLFGRILQAVTLIAVAAVAVKTGNPSLKEQRAEAQLERTARDACWRSPLVRATHPSKVSFAFSSTSTTSSTRAVDIGGPVDFQNVYGAMIPMAYVCRWERERIVAVQVPEAELNRRNR